MKAAIFSRVSTTKEGREGQEHGLESQIHACRELLKVKGLGADDAIVFEEQVSGRKDERRRPVLKKLLHEAALHRFQILVVFKLDRLTRGGISEMFRVLKALQGYGVRVYSVSEGWWDPDAPTAELVLAVIAWAAQFESRSIGERVASGIAARRAEAVDRQEPFLWGQARVSPRVRDPSLPGKVLELRRAGRSWNEIKAAVGIGRTTARKYCVLALAAEKESSPAPEAVPAS